eukprot:COSAG02_NODE_1488_length_12368_cov_23.731926_2_plen_992_part_00
MSEVPQDLSPEERANTVSAAAARACRLQDAPDDPEQTWRRHLEVSGFALEQYNGSYTRNIATFGFPCWARNKASTEGPSDTFQHLAYNVLKNKWCFLETGFCDFATCTNAMEAFGLMDTRCAASSQHLLGQRKWQVSNDDGSSPDAEITVSPQVFDPDHAEKYTEPTDLAEMNDFTKELEDAASGLRNLDPPFRHALGSLLRESDTPPVTVALGGERDEPAVWEFEVEGEWTKLHREACQLLEHCLSDALATKKTTTAEYDCSFGDGMCHVLLQGDQPTRCLEIAKQVNKDSQKTNNLRRNMWGNGATVSVQQWYQAVLMGDLGAHSQTFADEKPQYVAFRLDALQHDTENFETAMTGLLAKMHGLVGKAGGSEEEHDLFFKDDSWQPMIAHVVKLSHGIPLDESIDPVEPKKVKGLGTTNDLVTKMLSPRKEDDSVCIMSLYRFFEALITPQKKVLDEKKKTEEAFSKLQDTLKKSELLEQLDNVSSDYLDNVSLFRHGLPKFGIAVEPDAEDAEGMPNLKQAVKEFEALILEKQEETDTDLLRHRKALFAQLYTAMEAVRERTKKMVAIQDEVEQRAREAASWAEGNRQTLREKQQQARRTVTATQEKIEWVNEQVSEELSRRQQERENHKSTVTTTVKENQEKQAQVQKLLAEIKANEEKLRDAAQTDKDAEKQHQHTVAAYEQNLGALTGCLDEMQAFVDTVDVSIRTVDQAREITTELLVKHECSIKHNIESDVQKMEALGRTLLTQHYVEYCKAYVKSGGDVQWLLYGQDVLKLKIQNNRVELVTAKNLKIRGEVQKLNEQHESLKAQVEQRDAEIVELNQELESMYAGVMPVLGALGDDGEPGRDFKLVEGRDDALLQDLIKVTEHCAPPEDPRGELDMKIIHAAFEKLEAAEQWERDQLKENMREFEGLRKDRMKQLEAKAMPEPESEPESGDDGGSALLKTCSQRRAAGIVARISGQEGDIAEGNPPQKNKPKKKWFFGGED